MCEPKARVPVGSVLAAVAVVAAVPAVAYAASAIAAVAMAVVAADGVAAVVLITFLVRVLRPRRVRVRRYQSVTVRQVLAARAALPAPRRAIEAPGLRVVPGAVVRNGETIRP